MDAKRNNDGSLYIDSNLLKSLQVDPYGTIEVPPVGLSIKETDAAIPFATLGNISLIMGKAKSRKTFLSCAFAAGAGSKNIIIDRIIGSLPSKQGHVVFIDTEQAGIHAQRSSNRIARLGGDSAKTNLTYYKLRKFSPQDRTNIIGEIIRKTPNLGLLVIDGIRDLVNSINDEKEATKTLTQLLSWSEENNIHIMCVLHQNKGDYNARGHLGTELVNKAETVFSVELINSKGGFSVVRAEYSRDLPPKSFAFKIDEAGLPCLFDGWTEEPKPSKAKAARQEDLKDPFLWTIFSNVFQKDSSQKFRELMENVKMQLLECSHSMGDSQMTPLINRCVESGLITKLGKPRSVNATYQLGTMPNAAPNAAPVTAPNK